MAHYTLTQMKADVDAAAAKKVYQWVELNKAGHPISFPDFYQLTDQGQLNIIQSAKK